MRKLSSPTAALAALSLLGAMGGAVMAQETDGTMASATVQGQVFFNGVMSSGAATMDGGFWRMEDMGISMRVDADDDRLDGAGFVRSNSSKYPFPLEVQAGVYDIANDDGRWVGTVTAFVEPTMGIDRDTVILSGEGAYEGLTAYLLIDWSSLPADFIGAIFPGEMPPFPASDDT